MKLFALIMHICAHPELGYEEPAVVGEPRPREDYEQFFMHAGAVAGQDALPKIDMFRETIRAPDVEIDGKKQEGKTLGYRFIWFILDKRICMNRAIERVIAENAKKKVDLRSELKSTIDKRPFCIRMVESIASHSEFIDDILAPYDRNLNVRNICYLTSLQEYNNPANIYHCLSFERDLINLFEGVQPAQCDLNQYVSVANPAVADSLVSYRFPRGAQRMRPLFQHPVVQFALRLYETDASKEWTVGLNPAQQLAKIVHNVHAARKIRVLQRENIDEDMMDDVRELNRCDLHGKTREEKNVLRNSEQFMDRFKRLTSADAEISPTLKTVFAWMNEKRRKAEADNRRFIVYSSYIHVTDPTLDWTGNMFARFTNCLELVEYVMCVHEEIILAYICSNGAFERAYELKLHILFCGPPASGKSYIHDILKRLSIDHTYENVSSVTARANATEIDNNGKVLLWDEMPGEFFDKNKNDEEIKEIFSRGTLTIKQCFIEDDGTRSQKVTIAKHQSITIGCSNRLGSDISDALRTRLFIRSVPLWKMRDGKDIVDHLMVKSEMSEVPAKKKDRERFEYECKCMQMLCAIIYTMIYTGQMVAPDMSVALTYFRIYKQKLAETGITIAARDMMRLWRFAQTITIMTAIHIVFFTQEMCWEDDHPFELADVLCCQQYMLSTEQIAVFSLTMLGDMFVHPQMDMVIKSMAIKNCLFHQNPTPDQAKCASYAHLPVTRDRPEATTDFHYLQPILTIPKDANAFLCLATVITRSMVSDDKSTMKPSPEMVCDILNSLLDKQMVSHIYDADGDKTGKMESMPVIKVRDYPRAVMILRDFVEKAHKRTETILVDTIMKSWHYTTPLQRLVLGNTLRSSDEFYPQFLRVILSSPVNLLEAMIKIPNPSAIDVNMMSTFNHTVEAEELQKTTPSKLDVDTDLENEFFLRYMDQLGVSHDQIADNAYPASRREGPMRQSPYDAFHYPQIFLENVQEQDIFDNESRKFSNIKSMHTRDAKRPEVLPSDRLMIISGVMAGTTKVADLPTNKQKFINEIWGLSTKSTKFAGPAAKKPKTTSSSSG